MDVRLWKMIREDMPSLRAFEDVQKEVHDVIIADRRLTVCEVAEKC